MSADDTNLFDTKYEEFAESLLDVFPELETPIRNAISLSESERLDKYKSVVLPGTGSPDRDRSLNPRTVLPGVTITDAAWAEVSEATRKSIHDYITLMSVACFLQTGGGDLSGVWATWSKDKGAMDDFMSTWADKLGGLDIGGLMGKFSGFFGLSGEKVPTIPEKFLKGHIARLAEEIVRDFNPRDLGFTDEELERLEKDPGRAFEVMMKLYSGKPDFIQGAIKKIGKRLQEKIASGAIRPQEIANEAEELMKVFSENPAFVEMMGSFRSMFGMEDMGLARQAGREGSARLAIVRERLRKKLDAKKAAAGAAAAGAAAATTAPAAPQQQKAKGKRK
jgi:hypothetical protein